MKKEQTLKRCRKAKSPLFNFRVTPEDRRRLQEKADKHTNGNVTAWVKYAALELSPKKEDVE